MLIVSVVYARSNDGGTTAQLSLYPEEALIPMPEVAEAAEAGELVVRSHFARNVEKLTRPLRNRVAVMVSRAVLQLVDDSLRMQGVQVVGFAGETLDRVERFQNYGFTSVPHGPDDDGAAEAIVLALGGQRQHPVVIAVDDRRYRPTGLADGEVALYTREHTDSDPHIVHLKQGREIEMRAGEITVTMSGSNVVVSCPGTITLDSGGDTLTVQ